MIGTAWHVPAAPISQLAACATVTDDPRAGVVPYSTVLSPATFVHQRIVMVVRSASGFWMIGPRVMVCASAGLASATRASRVAHATRGIPRTGRRVVVVSVTESPVFRTVHGKPSAAVQRGRA